MAYSKEDGRYRPTKKATVPKATVSSNVTNSNEGRYRPITTPTMPKVTVATSTMPKITVSSNSVNTDERRYRPTATPAMPKVTISYNAANSSAESPSFWERAKDTVSGALGKSTASDINMAANLYDFGQGGRDTMANYYLSEYEADRKEAQRALEQMIEDGASARDIADQKAIVDDFQRKYNAMSMAGSVQRGATKAAYGLADDVKSSAEAQIDHAKDGLNALERFAVDTGVNWVQTNLDAAKSMALLGGGSVLPLIGRKYGEHTQDARQAGADVERATFYGAAATTVDAFIEKLFDGHNGAYGEDSLLSLPEKHKEKLKEKFKGNARIQNLIEAGYNDVGEGAESLATDAADQILKFIYSDENVVKDLLTTERRRVLRNALVNTIVGIFSGDKAFGATR